MWLVICLNLVFCDLVLFVVVLLNCFIICIVIYYIVYLQRFNNEEIMIGNNLKLFRDANMYTQEQVAKYLGVERGTLSNYERETREVPLDVLMKLSSLFGAELSDFYEEDQERLEDKLVCSFRMDNLSDDDMKQVAKFKDMVMGYLKMERLL